MCTLQHRIGGNRKRSKQLTNAIGDRGSEPPPPPLLKNHKNIGFPKQYWSGSPKKSQSYKCTKPAFNVGPPSARQRNAMWRFTGGSLVARLLWYLDPLVTPHQLKKKLSKLDPPGSAHECLSKIARNSVLDCHSLATNCNLKLCH